MRRPTGVVGAILALALCPCAATAQDAVPGEPSLSGRDIYRRVLDNRLETSYQTQHIVVTDGRGRVKTFEFWSRFKRYRATAAAKGDVLSKTVLKFTEPFDRRETGYLLIEKRSADNEGFHFSKLRDRVRRIDPSSELISGTDFSLNDLTLVRHIDDATYRRLRDEEVQGFPVWVVEIVPRPDSDAPHPRSFVYVDQEREVPLRTIHLNDQGVAVKELTAPRERIEKFKGVWIPMELTMRDIVDGTSSTLYVEGVDANLELDERLFNPKRLARMH